MRCVLDKNVALRPWERIPWACYIWGHAVPRRLEREEFELLERCDDGHDLEPAPLFDRLVERGFAHPAEKSETWDSWSASLRYGNRLFHSVNWDVTGGATTTAATASWRPTMPP